ncbi:uncharacterized protein METZ01_LOCUS1918 [marine metagenome]|uniref:Uncharacterized protein n=1 Tax=marine metagenome TaxID=408172 RepID=A0A381N4R4_9ZZZZ
MTRKIDATPDYSSNLRPRRPSKKI